MRGIVLSMLLVAAGAVSAEGTVTDIASAEKSGLASVGEVKLASLLDAEAISDVRPKARKPVSIEYTQSWLSKQARPKLGAQAACLAEALYFEARGESVKGQFAVAEVILNRVDSPAFPNSICGVIHQGTGKRYGCQFTYTCDGNAEVIAEPRAYAQVGKVARAVLDGKAPSLTGGATYYHTTAVSPRWSRVFTRTTKIGVHMFYRDGVQTASN